MNTNKQNVMAQETLEVLTTTNLSDIKINILPQLENVLYVNSLLNDDIISDFHYNAVFSCEIEELPFDEFLDKWFLSELDVPQNSPEVMQYLCYIYN